MWKPLLALATPFALLSCVTYHTPSDGLVRARLNETVSLANGARLTPLKVLEDSRCPAGVQCVWAGQVRVSVMIDTNGGSSTAALTDGKPVSAAGGIIELTEIAPTKRNGVTIYPEEYRFAFRFSR